MGIGISYEGGIPSRDIVRFGSLKRHTPERQMFRSKQAAKTSLKSRAVHAPDKGPERHERKSRGEARPSLQQELRQEVPGSHRFSYSAGTCIKRTRRR